MEDARKVAVCFHRDIQREIKKGNPQLEGEEMDILRNPTYYKGIYERTGLRLRYTEFIWSSCLRPVVEILRASNRNPRVLDCGCKAGTESIFMALQGGRVLGIDIHAPAIQMAKKRVQYYEELYNKKIEVEFIAGNIVDLLSQGDELFHLIYIKEAISHIHPARVFLSQASKNLKRGGYLLITDTNKLNPVARFLAMKSRMKYSRRSEVVDPQTGRPVEVAHEELFSPKALKEILAQLGMKLISISYCGFIPPYIFRFNSDAYYNLSIRTEKLLSALPLKLLGMVYTIVARKAR